jgi:hypothetical protein
MIVLNIIDLKIVIYDDEPVPSTIKLTCNVNLGS